MKRIAVFIASVCALLSGIEMFGQIPVNQAKREARKNTTVNEWYTDAVTKTRWLFQTTVYDDKGREIQKAEYSRYGLKWKETYFYGENDRIEKEIHYNSNSKVESVHKFEYDSNGRKIRQLKYGPDGKLIATKVFEYIVK
ncbi:MAG: hypothetical protein IJU69_06575 [Bacteroidales bacterium]|nr:hypothetical protein [Bacteroidales bacterium]